MANTAVVTAMTMMTINSDWEVSMQAGDVKTRWIWMLRYAVVIVVALVLAAALGEMQLFKSTTLGKTLTAARIVQFLGYGAALCVFWMMAQRVAAMLPARDEGWNVLKSILLPLATLIVVACGQAVLLLVLAPLMNKAWLQAYNWVVITGIVAAAAWLVAALFMGSASLAPLFGAARSSVAPNKTERQA